MTRYSKAVVSKSRSQEPSNTSQKIAEEGNEWALARGHSNIMPESGFASVYMSPRMLHENISLTRLPASIPYMYLSEQENSSSNKSQTTQLGTSVSTSLYTSSASPKRPTPQIPVPTENITSPLSVNKNQEDVSSATRLSSSGTCLSRTSKSSLSSSSLILLSASSLVKT